MVGSIGYWRPQGPAMGTFTNLVDELKTSINTHALASHHVCRD